MPNKLTIVLKVFPIIVCLTILAEVTGPSPRFFVSSASAQASIPPVWDVMVDNFESGRLDSWQRSSPGNLAVTNGVGHNSSTGLSVTLTSASSYIYLTRFAKAEEGYITFWFNPNDVSIPDRGTSWIPGKSLTIAEVVNSTSWWPPIVSLYVRRPAGQAYQAYLGWSTDATTERYYDYDNAFLLTNGWQQITIGYRINKWVGVWLNGELKRYATNVVHTDPYGDVVYIGKVRDTSNSPSGSIRFDDVAIQIPRIDNLWVNAANGSDNNSGVTPNAALRTIQRAADQAGPGTIVHIMPGVYRENVAPVLNGTADEPVNYIAENGRGTVSILGSDPSSSVTWTQLSVNTIGLPPGVNPNSIYSADLSAWNLDGSPRFVVELDASDHVTARLPLARAPNWNAVTEWKYPEFWWAADGGASPANCDPVTNPDPDCDVASRSMTQLTDRTSDVLPSGVETGNLTTLGDLAGATLVAIDTKEGTSICRRTITGHNRSTGLITVDKNCEIGSGSGTPGLGWGTKYYVEGKPSLLDTPGEWWYDKNTRRIYLWPLTPGNPGSMKLEISHRANGFSLSNRSYITLKGLSIAFFDGSAIFQVNGETEKSYGNTIKDLSLSYCNYGVNIQQHMAAGTSSDKLTDGTTVEDSEIAYIDSQGILVMDWWGSNADPDLFTRSGVSNTTILNNELHHLGFRSDDDGVGAWFRYANKLRFEGNKVHDIAHNGVQFSFSVIQSNKGFGFEPAEIKTGDILIKDNVFEKACQLTTDCGSLKFYGSGPDQHVFRNVLIIGNIFRNTFGWSYISGQRRRWSGGENSQIRGMGGFGLYVDHASGIHAYRNISYNNAYADYMFYGQWRDGVILYANNIAANSLYGMSLGGQEFDTHGSVSTQLLNNILINNEAFGLDVRYAPGRTANMTIDHNLYFMNGWRAREQGGLDRPGAILVWEGSSYKPYQTLAEAQANTPWEDHGRAGDPAFWSYAVTDHELLDSSWPSFHLTGSSTDAIDQGTTSLPASLTQLINTFGAVDFRSGPAFDTGRYEAGFLLIGTPPLQSIDPGSTARYALELFPQDIPYNVRLAAPNPSPFNTVRLSSSDLTGAQVTTLTVTDSHPRPLNPGIWYDILITGTGGGFSNTTNLDLFVGGTRIYLPMVRR